MNRCDELVQALFDIALSHNGREIEALFDAVTKLEHSYGPNFKRIPGVGRRILVALSEARDLRYEVET